MQDNVLCSSTKFPNYPSGSKSHANHFENCLSQVESKLVFFCRFSNVFVVVVVVVVVEVVFFLPADQVTRIIYFS